MPTPTKKVLHFNAGYARIAIAAPADIPVLVYAEVLESADRHV